MDDKELKERLNSIRRGLNIFGIRPNFNHADRERKGFDPNNEETWTYVLSHKQANAIRELSDLFNDLNWQLALNDYKEIIRKEDDPIDKTECGTPVKIRPCGEQYEDKTYFGILIGDVPLSISCSVDQDKNLKIKRSFYNPAIFVPELNDIIYGSESWWGRVASEEEMNELITDDVIQNVWYMKILTTLRHKDGK